MAAALRSRSLIVCAWGPKPGSHSTTTSTSHVHTYDAWVPASNQPTHLLDRSGAQYFVCRPLGQGLEPLRARVSTAARVAPSGHTVPACSLCCGCSPFVPLYPVRCFELLLSGLLPRRYPGCARVGAGCAVCQVLGSCVQSAWKGVGARAGSMAVHVYVCVLSCQGCVCPSVCDSSPCLSVWLLCWPPGVSRPKGRCVFLCLPSSVCMPACVPQDGPIPGTWLQCCVLSAEGSQLSCLQVYWRAVCGEGARACGAWLSAVCWRARWGRCGQGLLGAAQVGGPACRMRRCVCWLQYSVLCVCVCVCVQPGF